MRSIAAKPCHGPPTVSGTCLDPRTGDVCRSSRKYHLRNVRTHSADACVYGDADDCNAGAGKNAAAVQTNPRAVLLSALLAPRHGHHSGAACVDVPVGDLPAVLF